MHALTISPLDGRYHDKTEEIRNIFCDFSFTRQRVYVETMWLLHLSTTPAIKELPKFQKKTSNALMKICSEFDYEDYKRVKEIEKTTNHDIKAIEYFIGEKIEELHLPKIIKSFTHFACTSEDINNVAYSLMLRDAIEVMAMTLFQIFEQLVNFCEDNKNTHMLGRTHGQPATPTTISKEILNFVARLHRQLDQLSAQPILAKFNGAVGNYSAHVSAYPKIAWGKVCRQFIEDLELTFNDFTTQIEPHDGMAELFHNMIRINNILIDFSRDIWGYISFGYLGQKAKKGEIGSSTMPHKINPIDFENAEGNLGIANALFDHFANKLTISRFQRDLSDSTVLRNLGVTFAHSLLAYKSLQKGINKLKVNKSYMKKDLDAHPEVMAEAIQTIMRKKGIDNPYEKLKDLTRGKKVTKALMTKLLKEAQD